MTDPRSQRRAVRRAVPSLPQPTALNDRPAIRTAIPGTRPAPALKIPRGRQRGDSVSGYARTELSPEPAAPRRARALTRDALARWNTTYLLQDAETVAAELAANAVAAAVPPTGTLPAIIFAVQRRPGEVRISVWDNGRGQPQPLEVGVDDEHGRGLAMIDALTGRQWGWWPTPNSGGKVVWAALRAASHTPLANQA